MENEYGADEGLHHGIEEEEYEQVGAVQNEL
jgi:hypothetical protein